MAGNRTQYEEALKRARIFNQRQEWRKAISMLRVALQEFPGKPEPYSLLGQACSGLKQWDKALDVYKRAARYSGGDIIYLNKVADMQERLGQLSDAGQTYMAAGELQMRKNNLEQAEANWQRAIRLEPDLLGAHRRLAMLYQRQNNITAAVREYLAIARILDMRGEKKKALQMCKAALRLDPENDDILKAVELIRYGEDAVPEIPDEEPDISKPQAEAADGEMSLADTVRHMAAVLEGERRQAVQPKAEAVDPVELARRQAQEQLAAEIFRDEEDEDELYGTGEGLSKLERDALIGQGIDFQSRGQLADAITCYEKAIRGGLSLAAAHFTLGLLYLDVGRQVDAQNSLRVAAQDAMYRTAVQAAL
ncbi:MAG: tetratricopeptide repeat protein [Ardenticatenaceae bacterium]|nr:tetratricopeptide repeat protein [Anaerolineales bacterium]MCB8922446.1 tetratricopeptide repeat protein [Ardenticatenaceae bacterium]MCB8989914.1 tetratricopeptide repeat protein [Ardenticatenaceae bacterium]